MLGIEDSACNDHYERHTSGTFVTLGRVAAKQRSGGAYIRTLSNQIDHSSASSRLVYYHRFAASRRVCYQGPYCNVNKRNLSQLPGLNVETCVTKSIWGYDAHGC